MTILLRTKQHVFSAISLEFVPTPKLASLKVGPSLVYFSQNRQKNAKKRINHSLCFFHGCQKNRLVHFFVFLFRRQEMVATRFSLLKLNHLFLKKREILTSGILAAGQKTFFDMLAQLLNTFTLGYRRVLDINDLFQTFSSRLSYIFLVL